MEENPALRERNKLTLWRDNGETKEILVCYSFNQLRRLIYKEMNCILKLLISVHQLQMGFRSFVDNYGCSDEAVQR